KTISTVFRVNYRTAWLLASRIYLYMEQWDKVIAYTNKLIGDYPILSDLNVMTPPVAQAYYGTKNASFIHPSNTDVLVMFCGAKSADWVTLIMGKPLCIASSDLISQYETNDMRFGVYTISNPPPNYFLTKTSGYYMNSKFWYSNAQACRSFRMAEAYVN